MSAIREIDLACGHTIDVSFPPEAPEDIYNVMVRLIETLSCAKCQPTHGREEAIR